MPITFYMDHHVPRAVTLGLRLRKADVITAYEDGTSEIDDAEILDRAGELGRVLFTRDDDLLAEATRRQREGIPFHGIVYAHQLRVSIGRCVEDLGLIAKVAEPVDLMDQVTALKSGMASIDKLT
jgi:predicted nuclease of predicted toxin-antitoxin system